MKCTLQMGAKDSVLRGKWHYRLPYQMHSVVEELHCPIRPVPMRAVVQIWKHLMNNACINILVAKYIGAQGVV